jgi:hypothetical protein
MHMALGELCLLAVQSAHPDMTDALLGYSFDRWLRLTNRMFTDMGYTPEQITEWVSEIWRALRDDLEPDGYPNFAKRVYELRPDCFLQAGPGPGDPGLN